MGLQCPRISMASQYCNDWGVDVRGFGDGLMISQRISDDQHTGFTENRLNLIG
jgi:hypothetical protein